MLAMYCRAREWKDFVDINVRHLENGDPVPCVLVANKLDLGEEDRKVSETELAGLLKEGEFDRLFTVSAKSGLHVREAFEHLVVSAKEKREGAQALQRETFSLTLTKELLEMEALEPPKKSINEYSRPLMMSKISEEELSAIGGTARVDPTKNTNSGMMLESSDTKMRKSTKQGRKGGCC